MLVAAGALLTCALATGWSRRTGPDAELVIRGIDVLTMNDPELLENRDVEIGDGRILRIRRARDGLRTGSATVVDGAGLTLLPGLVDMHVHVRSEWALPLYLAHGITTVRSMNGAFGDPLSWRDEIDSGSRMGPAIVAASPTIRLDRGDDYDFRAANVASARHLVRIAAERGYDLIKVYQVADSVLPTLIETADSLGLPVAGHVPYFVEDDRDLEDSRRAFRDVLRTGMGIEHLGGMQHAWFRGDTATASVGALATAVAEAAVPVTPMISADLAYARIVLDGERAWSQTERARIRRLAGEPGMEQLRNQVEGLHGTEPWATRQTRVLLKALYDAGVTLLAGTDSHQASALAGVSLIDELGALVAVGIAPYDALRTATVNPARVLGRSHTSGSVETGKEADLLLLHGNPLEDWTALRRIAGVVRAGAWLPRARLDAMVDEAIRHGTHCLRDRCE